MDMDRHSAGVAAEVKLASSETIDRSAIIFRGNEEFALHGGVGYVLQES